MYRHNSTIRIKKKACVRCGIVGPIFSRGRCGKCATIEDTLSRMAEDEESELESEGLSKLIQDADAIFSKFIRLNAANKDGWLPCYICGTNVRWQDAQNMHFIPRGHSLLRFDEKRNCRAGCINCNQYLSGNLALYRQKLNEEMPGLPDILEEEARIPYKLTRDEVKNISIEYGIKFKNLVNSRK